MIEMTLETASLSELFGLIEKVPGAHSHLFRGQSDSSWGLSPSLYRLTPNIVTGSIKRNYDALENTLIERFFQEGLPYLPPISRSYANNRALAQHFGVPTRLLDWSEDPLVATFFAVDRWEAETDSAIFVLVPEIRWSAEDIDNARLADAFELSPYSEYQTSAFRPPAIDRRIPAQRSVFTLHPHEPSDEPFVPLDRRSEIGGRISNPNGTVRGFAKITIPKAIKRQLLHRLMQIGVDRRNLFPGLDGVGADVAARARTGQWR